MCRVLAGIDEVGVGALCGPAVFVAVKLDIDIAAWPLHYVRDSKQTTELQRENMDVLLAAFIEEHNGEIGIGIASVEDFNTLGHAKATRRAQGDAVRTICQSGYPDLLVVDGPVGVDGYSKPQRCEPKADANYFIVALASILAKLYRDHEMLELAKQFPMYGWEHSKGYGTPEHLRALATYGPCIHHRTKATTKAMKTVRRDAFAHR